MLLVRRLLCMLLAFCWLVAPMTAFAANEELSVLFEKAAAEVRSPAQARLETGMTWLHPGESAYFPSVAPEITPFDEKENTIYPPVNGTFSTTDESVVTVDEKGLMTAVAEGVATVTYHTGGGDVETAVTVDDEVPTEIAQNAVTVALREYYETKKARLPKYNKYAKWYYGKKKEVGWCSVFGIWVANAAGTNPLKKSEAKEIPDTETLYLREGQVGAQYDGFYALERFGAIPKPGYMVIYADMKNAYRTTHIGIVVAVDELEDGIYRVMTVEGNMSNTVKAYSYLYDSNLANHMVGKEKGRKLQWNMREEDKSKQENPLVQYDLHTAHWSVFGFCETWK